MQGQLEKRSSCGLLAIRTLAPTTRTAEKAWQKRLHNQSLVEGKVVRPSIGTLPSMQVICLGHRGSRPMKKVKRLFVNSGLLESTNGKISTIFAETTIAAALISRMRGGFRSGSTRLANTQSFPASTQLSVLIR